MPVEAAPQTPMPAWVAWPAITFPAPATAPPIVTFAELPTLTPPPSFCTAAAPAALVPR